MGKNLIGTRIKELRKSKGWTQEDLAARFQLQGENWGISRQTIAKIETGVKPLRDIEIVQFSLILETSIAELFETSDLLPRLQKFLDTNKKANLN
ncbi:transcriptional regulator [Vibrio crassostreae 9CS106]|uniref:Transcriptional regulator n=1 Tax=Vibrio lentus TaxID=136468 RepID=A0A2N7IMY5_9VIBR|nr:helix-turn-helix transcriptional regulator [Vibrio lentus]ANP76945.1 transcriptional regulator [Vibrio crassostreae 9CS106]MCZ8501358.1 helix-turn-helix transcriptional regulator [Vibrio lentus]PML59457.1 transcriptional regulator [Vibrio lentus]PMM38787.1 transcriptional regulator [Vibrio lentus]